MHNILKYIFQVQEQIQKSSSTHRFFKLFQFHKSVFQKIK